MPLILSLRDAVDIKRRIWNGEKQKDIAASYSIKQPTVSRIASGEQWFDAPWPDGSVGPLSYDRRVAIHTKVRPATRLAGARENDSQVQRIHRAAMDDILDRVEQAISDQDESRLLATIQSVEEGKVVGESPEDVEAIRPEIPPLERSKWDEVQKAHGNLPLVQAARQADDLAKICVLLVFDQLPESEWSSDLAIRLAATVRKEFERSS